MSDTSYTYLVTYEIDDDNEREDVRNRLGNGAMLTPCAHLIVSRSSADEIMERVSTAVTGASDKIVVFMTGRAFAVNDPEVRDCVNELLDMRER